MMGAAAGSMYAVPLWHQAASDAVPLWPVPVCCATVACMLCRCGLYAVPLWPVCCATVAWPSRCMLCRPLYTGHSGTARRPCAACRPQRYSIRATLAVAQHTGHSGTCNIQATVAQRYVQHAGHSGMLTSIQATAAQQTGHSGTAYRPQWHSRTACRPHRHSMWATAAQHTGHSGTAYTAGHSGTVFRPERHSTNRLQRHSIHATSVCTAYKPQRHSIQATAAQHTGHSGTAYYRRQRRSIVSILATAAQHTLAGHSGTAVEHAGHSGTACGPRNRLHVYMYPGRAASMSCKCVYI